MGRSLPAAGAENGARGMDGERDGWGVGWVGFWGNKSGVSDWFFCCLFFFFFFFAFESAVAPLLGAG